MTPSLAARHSDSPRRAVPFIAALLVLFLGVGCNPGGNTPPPVLHVVEARNLSIGFEEMGVVEAVETIRINAPFNAKIIELLASGTAVKEGDVIAVLDYSTIEKGLDDQLETLKGLANQYQENIESLTMEIRSNALDVDTAQGELDFQRVRLEEVNRRLSRLQTLREEEVVAQDEVRTAQSDRERSTLSTQSRDLRFRSQMTGAAISESGLTTTLERLVLDSQRKLREIAEREAELREAVIRARAPGLFYRRQQWNWQRGGMAETQPGDDISRGEQLGELPRLDNVRLRTQIPESQRSRVEAGMNVEATFDTLGGTRISGTLDFIAPIAIERERSAGGSLAVSDSFSGERVFEAIVLLDRGDVELRPGLSARVRYLLSRLEGRLAIPVEAVWTRGDKRLVAIADGKIRFAAREVQIGAVTDGYVEVTSGLHAGESILATDPRRVLDGVVR